jgi:hypothetical protein
VALLLLLIPIVAVIAVLLMLRDMPRRRQISFIIFALAWSCIVCVVVGYELGRISSQYREAIAIRNLIRDTDRALAADEVQQVKDAFSEANRMVRDDGDLDGAARLIGEQLQPASSP